MSDLPVLLTIDEVAEYLRMTPQAVQKTRERGQEPGSLGFRRGRKLLWRRTDLEAWIDGPETFDADHAVVLELQAATKLLRKISSSLDTVVWYLAHAEETIKERDDD